MLNKSRVLSFSMLACLSAAQALPVLAQQTPGTAPTTWETNQLNQINQDAASGAINAGQAAALQNREAQIQAQQQQYMTQNGGTLTPQQQHQIDSELRGVNKRLNGDVRYNAAAQGVPGGVPGVAAPWQNGYAGQGQWQRPQWQNYIAPQQWQNGTTPPISNPQQWQSQQNGNQQWQSHGHHHHHDHDGDGDHHGYGDHHGNNGGYGSNNGGYGGNNGGYGGNNGGYGGNNGGYGGSWHN